MYESQKQYYIKNKEKIRAKARAKYAEDPKKFNAKTIKSKYRDAIVIDLFSDNSSVNVAGIKKVNMANATDVTLGLNQEP